MEDIIQDTLGPCKRALEDAKKKPGDINEIVWLETIRQNRIIMGIGSVVFLLLGLLNLQKREKFLR